MAQIKIYGLKEVLDPIKLQLSEIIHSCAMEVLQLPIKKRFHRFFPLDRSDFFFPDDRSIHYTIIEVSLFEGRSLETKKAFIKLLFSRIEKQLDISPQDGEITIFETPQHNWGIRGLPGDELALNYQVNI